MYREGTIFSNINYVHEQKEKREIIATTTTKTRQSVKLLV